MSKQTSSIELAKGGHLFALPNGTKLLEFEIEALLGHGGFGITYRAVDTLLQETVAIKEFLPNELAVRISDATVRPKSDGDALDFQAGLKAFLEEARVLTRFRHPNIVHVRRFFELHGTGYIALDYERGQTLSQRLAKGPIPNAELVNILMGLLQGLETVHDRAVLHRDLKPSNIIVREDGSPVLIDFGAARDFKERHSRSITAIAAPGYSPPEQYGVGGQQGPWTDIYALGAIAYRCVTGNVPIDSLRRLRKDPLAPAVKAAVGKYDMNLLRAIDWMLAIEGADRPGSAQQLRNGLANGPSALRKSAKSKSPGPSRTRQIAAAVAAVVVLVGSAAAFNLDHIRTFACDKADMLCNSQAIAGAKTPIEPAITANATPASTAMSPAAVSSPAAPKSVTPTPSASDAARRSDPDEFAWDFLKDSRDAAELGSFIRQFPTSPRRAEAAARLAAMGQPFVDAAAGAVSAPAASAPVQGATPTPAAGPASPGPSAGAPPHAVPPVAPAPDEIAWDMVKDADDPRQLRLFIERFPSSSRKIAATARIALLEERKSAAATPATPAPNTQLAARQPTPFDDPTFINDGNLLRELRSRLYELNFDPGPSDMSRNDLMQQAIREFQSASRLASTGQATMGLLQRLRQTDSLQPWGAVVFMKGTDKWGMAWGHETRGQAVASARASCGDACPIEVSFFGRECAAFAYSDSSWAIVSRDDIQKAKDAALDGCRKKGKNCRVIASICANGSDRNKATR